MTYAHTQVVLLLALVGLPGCSSVRNNSDYIRIEDQRNPQLARELNRTGVQHVLRGEFGKAEIDFKQAIQADESFGPAHNNLGRVYFHQHDLRLAALSFQRASELMPDSAEPINNVGLVYEAGAQLDKAHEMFLSAHLLQPDHAEYLGNLIRSRVRRGEKGDVLRQELRQLLFVEKRPDWVNWAEYHLALSTGLHQAKPETKLEPKEIQQPEWLLPPSSETVPTPLPLLGEQISPAQ